MPNPMTAEIYAQLARAANAKNRSKNRPNPYEPDFHDVLGDVSQEYVPGTLDEEAGLNFDAKNIVNRVYDSSQPYGFDFRHDAEPFGYPRDNAIEVGEDGVPRTQFDRPVYDVGEGLVDAGSEDDLFPEARKAMLPIVQTAGSYALPILFSMLMRGGK